MAETYIKVRIDLNLTERQVMELCSIAVFNGYMRVDPRRSWGPIERKEAVRFAMEKLAKGKLP